MKASLEQEPAILENVHKPYKPEPAQIASKQELSQEPKPAALSEPVMQNIAKQDSQPVLKSET